MHFRFKFYDKNYSNTPQLSTNKEPGYKLIGYYSQEQLIWKKPYTKIV